ncbi:hypothetical protein AB0H76_09620 [Nocardia sp. NPDC050712]|uniref:DUF3885 domain-containing protein n=1 Tax=Nocardia sp. NPDC050712 TaxID=3155518 RepID=UPI0034013C8F
MHEDDLLRRWEEHWPACPPIAHALKSAYPDRWIRFHSLPESKRYPDTANEYAIVLDRYNTILDELFSDQVIYVITADWSQTPRPAQRSRPPARWQPGGAQYWTSICNDDPDPEYITYTHLYFGQTPWERGCLDELLHAVTDEVTAGVLITDIALERIHHPYDGGSDVILTTTDERDRLRSHHAEWLSSHPLGL